MSNLARFRADPSKVRVSIRRVFGEYRVTVESKLNDSKFWVTNQDPATATDAVLGAADRCDMDGIDLNMMETYPHPMKD